MNIRIPTRNFCEFSQDFHTRTRNSCVFCKTSVYTRTRKKALFCRVRTGPYPGYLRVCATFIPIPSTFVSSVRRWHNTRGTGMPYKNTRLRVRVRVQHLYTYLPTRNFWGLCKTSVPVPGTSGSSIKTCIPVYPELLEVKKVLCSVGYVQNRTRGVTRTRNLL